MSPMDLRPKIAQHLDQRLRAFGDGFRHNLALIGPPGSGKSFQLEQLIGRAPAGIFVVYCRLYRESCRSFLSRLLSTIIESGGAGSVTPGQRAVPLESLLQTLEPQAPRTVAAARAIEPLLGRRLYGEALNRILDLIPLLVEERRQPCVLVRSEEHTSELQSQR